MPKKHVALIACFTLIASGIASVTQADDWGHWRGEGGNGVSLNATPPTEFSSTKNVKWKVAIPGKSSGSPVVWGDRVFAVSGIPDGNAPQSEQREQPARRSGRRRGRPAAPLQTLKFTVFCFDRATGKELWKKVAVEAKPHEGTHSTNNFAAASPCTDGTHIYAHFGSRGLYCYTMDGEFKWKRDDLGKMKTRATFGEGSSPTISGDHIIVPWDHEGQSALYSLNKLTGETVWKVQRDEPTNWATPLVIEVDGEKQIVMNGQNKARAYDFASGKELWSCGGQTQRPCASAVAGNGMVYIGSGYRGSFLGAFKANGSGDIQDTDNVVWTRSRDTPDVASPLLSGNRLYFYKEKTGILSCVNATTGEPFYSLKRVPGISRTYASPVAAGGYVFLSGRSGNITVIKDADKFEVVSTNSMDETVDATPALVDNELFIRGERHLFCIASK